MNCIIITTAHSFSPNSLFSAYFIRSNCRQLQSSNNMKSFSSSYHYRLTFLPFFELTHCTSPQFLQFVRRCSTRRRVFSFLTDHLYKKKLKLVRKSTETDRSRFTRASSSTIFRSFRAAFLMQPFALLICVNSFVRLCQLHCANVLLCLIRNPPSLALFAQSRVRVDFSSRSPFVVFSVRMNR